MVTLDQQVHALRLRVVDREMEAARARSLADLPREQRIRTEIVQILTEIRRLQTRKDKP